MILRVQFCHMTFSVFIFFLLFFVTRISPCLTAAPNRMSTFRFYHDDKTRDVRIPGEEERIAQILAFRALGLIWCNISQSSQISQRWLTESIFMAWKLFGWRRRGRYRFLLQMMNFTFYFFLQTLSPRKRYRSFSPLLFQQVVSRQP